MDRRGGPSQPSTSSSRISLNHRSASNTRGVKSCRGRKSGQALKFHNFVANERPVGPSCSTSSGKEIGRTLTHCLREEHGTKQITVSHWTSSAPASPEADEKGEPVKKKTKKDNRDQVAPLEPQSSSLSRPSSSNTVTVPRGHQQENLNLVLHHLHSSSQIKSPVEAAAPTVIPSTSSSKLIPTSLAPSLFSPKKNNKKIPLNSVSSGVASFPPALVVGHPSSYSTSKKAVKSDGPSSGGDTTSQGRKTGFEGIKIPRNHLVLQTRQHQYHQEERQQPSASNLLNLHQKNLLLQNHQESILEALLAKNFSTALANSLSNKSTSVGDHHLDLLHHYHQHQQNPLLDHGLVYHHLMNQEEQKQSSIHPYSRASLTTASATKTSFTENERQTKLPVSVSATTCLRAISSPSTMETGSKLSLSDMSTRGLSVSGNKNHSFHPLTHEASSPSTSPTSSEYSPCSSPGINIKVNKRKPLFVRRVITSKLSSKSDDECMSTCMIMT